MSSNSIKTFTPQHVYITSLDGETRDIGAMTTLFNYYEDIDRPFVQGILTVVDSGVNLIRTLPIQGGEDVEIELQCATDESGSVKNEIITYKFRIWKIYDRIFEPKIQAYKIALVTEEALKAEYVRISKRLTGTSDEIVTKLLSESLKTEKSINVEKSGNKHAMFPARKSVPSIISALKVKSRSEKVAPKTKKSTEITNTESDIQSDNESADGSVSGTAGYLFFENKNGFTFKSIDTICAVGNKGNFNGNDIIGTYYSRSSIDSENQQRLYNIEKYRFLDEIDIMDKFRRGVYSTKLVFYDISSGNYEEVNFSLKETFDNMVKLGFQDKLPEYQIRNEKYPTRVISMVVDNELWNQKEEPANPDEGGDVEYPDESKYLIAQGISRRNILNNQQLEITIPGNANLAVGEKIKVYLPNMAAEEIRKNDEWDTESSGFYLISRLSHNYFMANESGPEFTTVLHLIRDTYGMEEEPSTVK